MNLNKKFKRIQFIDQFCCALSTVFWILMLFSFEKPTIAITTLISSLIHESGHLLCMILYNNHEFRFRGVINGFRIRPTRIRSYEEEMFIFLSGPLANLFAFTICIIFSFVAGDGFLTIAVINLVTAISNLLPIKGYDGYGAIRALLKKIDFSGVALRMLSRLSSALIFLFSIISLYLIDRCNGGYWIFAVFFISMIKEFKEELGE